MNTEIAIVHKDIDETIRVFEKVKSIAEYVAKSETFSKGFEQKDKDGKVILDENSKPKINEADVAMCIMTGQELGLDLGGSLLYGKKLNRNTYLAAKKGLSLGVDISTAIEKVITIESKTTGNTVTYTMVDIISAKLLQSGIEFLPFIKNYAPFYIYKNNNGEELELDRILDENDDLKPEYALISLVGANDPKIAAEIKTAVAAAKDAGRTVVTREQHGYYSKAKFVRTYPDGKKVIHYQRFSSLDAERAGLLPSYGLAADGKTPVKVSDGKNNWITNTPQMMNNRVISIGGRIIGADLLNGIYTRDEIVSSGIVDEKDAPVIDADAEVVI